MIRDYIRLSDLLHRYLSGEVLLPEEECELSDWREASEDNERLYEQICSRKFSSKEYHVYYQTGDAEKSWNKIAEICGYRVHSRRIGRRWLGIAASLLLLVGVGCLWFWRSSSIVSVQPLVSKIATDRPLALLTLSDGRTVSLGVALNDSAFMEKENVIVQNHRGNLSYEGGAGIRQLVWNEIEVPRGGECQVTLSDGTKVWLNSDSRLKYPVAFVGNSREVSLLRGEAYFEVARDMLSSFVVRTSSFDIRVLGTEFNVRSYTENNKSVTLVRGKVQLEHAGEIRHLLPGQQGRLRGDKFEICPVDTEREISWRNGIFDFRECPLQIILEDLARWYDMDIFYQDSEVRNFHFTAWFNRNDSLTQVMELLEKTHKVWFRLDGKTLVVGKR
ncbi:MAG: FecR domain-containing protein [Odoribacter sp.]|nr:FecR domain-containing protein [Odoribacter sp.]